MVETLQCCDYGNTLLFEFYCLYEQQRFCDVEVRADDKVFHLHKLVLAGASDVLKSRLCTGDDSENIIVSLLDMSGEVMARLVQFMYTGRLEVCVRTLPEVLAGATRLRIQTAVKLCQQYASYVRENGVVHRSASIQGSENSGDTHWQLLNGQSVRQEESDAVSQQANTIKTTTSTTQPNPNQPPPLPPAVLAPSHPAAQFSLQPQFTLLSPLLTPLPPAPPQLPPVQVFPTPTAVPLSLAGSDSAGQLVSISMQTLNASENTTSQPANHERQIVPACTSLHSEDSLATDSKTTKDSIKAESPIYDAKGGGKLTMTLRKKEKSKPREVNPVGSPKLLNPGHNSHPTLSSSQPVTVKQECQGQTASPRKRKQSSPCNDKSSGVSNVKRVRNSRNKDPVISTPIQHKIQEHPVTRPEHEAAAEPRTSCIKRPRKRLYKKDAVRNKPKLRGAAIAGRSARLRCKSCGERFRHGGTLIWHRQHTHVPPLHARRRASVRAAIATLTSVGRSSATPMLSLPSTATLRARMRRLRTQKHMRRSLKRNGYENAAGLSMSKRKKRARACMAAVAAAQDRRRIHACRRCGRIFKHLRTLRQHVQLQHRGRTTPGSNTRQKTRKGTAKAEQEEASEIHSCSTCFYKTTMPERLTGHMERIHGLKHTCEACGQQFSRLSTLHHHQHTVHDMTHPSLQVLRCGEEGCAYSTVCRQNMQKHVATHDPHKPFPCPVCDKLLKTQITLERHIRVMHKKIKPYMCEVCGVSYGEEGDLRNHMKRHSETRSFQCDLCEYSAHDKGTFKSHLFHRHGQRLEARMRVYSCPLCAFETDVKYRFTDHMRAHEDKRDIPCPHCPKRFCTRKALRSHNVKVHMPKSLRCELCGYSTADASKLREHVRVVHTHRHVRPFACGHCGFTCATRGNCRKHVMQRHPELPVLVVKNSAVPQPDDVSVCIANTAPPTCTLDAGVGKSARSGNTKNTCVLSSNARGAINGHHSSSNKTRALSSKTTRAINSNQRTSIADSHTAATKLRTVPLQTPMVITNTRTNSGTVSLQTPVVDINTRSLSINTGMGGSQALLPIASALLPGTEQPVMPGGITSVSAKLVPVSETSQSSHSATSQSSQSAQSYVTINTLLSGQLVAPGTSLVNLENSAQLVPQVTSRQTYGSLESMIGKVDLNTVSLNINGAQVSEQAPLQLGLVTGDMHSLIPLFPVTSAVQTDHVTSASTLQVPPTCDTPRLLIDD